MSKCMTLFPLIKKAIYFAAEKHDKQYRKGTRVPYITHPMYVAFEIQKYTKNKQVIVATILHDVLEDCPGVSLSLLQKEFGKDVAKLVNEVSFLKNKKYKNWKEKKQAYLEKIKHVSKDALIIIAVDKMHNMQAYFDALKKKDESALARDFNGIPADYRWYYEEIGNILTSFLGKHAVVKDYLKIWRSYKK